MAACVGKALYPGGPIVRYEIVDDVHIGLTQSDKYISSTQPTWTPSAATSQAQQQAQAQAAAQQAALKAEAERQQAQAQAQPSRAQPTQATQVAQTAQSQYQQQPPALSSQRAGVMPGRRTSGPAPSAPSSTGGVDPTTYAEAYRRAQSYVQGAANGLMQALQQPLRKGRFGVDLVREIASIDWAINTLTPIQSHPSARAQIQALRRLKSIISGPFSQLAPSSVQQVASELTSFAQVPANAW